MKPTDALLYRRIMQEMCEAAPDDLTTIDGLTTGFVGQWADWLPHTEVYYVSADMTAIARAAGRQMPRQDLHADDPPSPDGFLIYDQALTHVELADGSWPVRGFAWTSTLLPDDDDSETPGIELLVLIDASASGRSAMVPIVQVNWRVGEEPWNADSLTYRDDVAKACLATWTLMQQSLAVTTRSHADRAERRRWFRRRQEPPQVLIVRLRRVVHGDDRDPGESDRQWSHRWLVGGHWRNQWLPSRGAHRLQWIAPYVKGPENLPLLVKDRVTAWTR